MANVEIDRLSADLPFGARLKGLSRAALSEEAFRAELRALLDDRGLIVFEEVEQSPAMQRAISGVFGPMKEIAAATGEFVDRDDMVGIVDIRHDPDNAGVVEIDGKLLSQWLPWHFDHCYSERLWRAAVLRPVVIPPGGGLTGFADGIDMYRNLPSALRERIEGRHVIYTLDVLFANMRFGRPSTFREIRVAPDNYAPSEYAKELPRALHPAVWTRPGGEKVLHLSPWMAVGIENCEDAEGDALLEEVCATMIERTTPYFHRWRPSDMLVWDNWRMLHSASGTDPGTARRMHRTTIEGDYGLGRLEHRRTDREAESSVG